MQEKLFSLQISKNEAWKLLDAVVAYQKDYSVAKPVDKIFTNISKKLQEVIGK